MRRIIINIDDECVTDERAVELVKAVIKQGRISQGPRASWQYCYVTKFKSGEFVFANKHITGTDSFRITKEAGQ